MQSQIQTSGVAAALRNVLASGAVLDDDATRHFYSNDIF